MRTKYFKIQLNLLMLGLAISGNCFALASEEYDVRLNPLGLTTGYTYSGFNIAPSLKFGNVYNSNIYMRDKNYGVLDSYVAHFSPGIKVDSFWNRHSLNLMIDTDFANYATQPKNNNYNNMISKLEGRLDILHNSYLEAGVGYRLGTVLRNSPDQITAMKQSPYVEKSFQSSYTHIFNWLTLNGGVSAIRMDYDNVESLTDRTLQMSSQNNWLYSSNLRLGHFFKREYEAFVNVIYSKYVYDTNVCTNGNCGNTGNTIGGTGVGSVFNRNSTSYNALTGMAFNISDLVKGDISVGYLQAIYEDPSLSEISGINGFGHLKWSPTTLTTVVANLGRVINPTTQAGVSGVLTTTMGVKVVHELMRNVILDLGVNYSNQLYQGYAPPNTTNRNDNTSMINFGGRYLLNKNLSTELLYSYQARDSNYKGIANANANYEANIIMLNFIGQY